MEQTNTFSVNGYSVLIRRQQILFFFSSSSPFANFKWENEMNRSKNSIQWPTWGCVCVCVALNYNDDRVLSLRNNFQPVRSSPVQCQIVNVAVQLYVNDMLCFCINNFSYFCTSFKWTDDIYNIYISFNDGPTCRNVGYTEVRSVYIYVSVGLGAGSIQIPVYF